MAKPTCHTCVFAYWDRGLWLRSMTLGMPLRPLCANHPDSPGRERETPSGRVCRNYRPRPKTPDPADETVKRIPITGGLYAYVDAADYPEISRWRWRMQGRYAMRVENGKKIYMHRQIMNPPKGKVVDHLDHNRMDNTRDNLRNVTPAENRRNHPKHRGSASRYFGVYYRTKRNKWEAAVFLNGRRKFIGYFDDEVEAARAYDRAAVELVGDAARLNFPDEWPPAKRRRVHAAAQDERKKIGRKEGKRKDTPSRTRRSSPRRTQRALTTNNHQRATILQPRTGNREPTTDLRVARKERRKVGTKEGKRKDTPAARKKAKRSTNSRKKRKGPKKQSKIDRSS